MKNIIKIAAFILAFVNVAQAAQLPTPTPFCTPNSLVTLKASTAILCELNQRVSIDDVKEGSTLTFKVRANVMASGRIVIRTNALAIGRVRYIKSSSYNDKAEIGIELRQVKAVDGQMVELDGNLEVLVGEFSNDGLVAFPGKNLTAQVMNSMDIDGE
jgi:hypothetical protein